MYINLKSAVTLALVGLLAATTTLSPAQAGGVDETLVVSVEITQTVPRVEGTVTVTDLDGNPVLGATVALATAHDTLPTPAATLDGATGSGGVFAFAYTPVSTTALPGSQTVSASVSFGDEVGSGSTSYGSL